MIRGDTLRPTEIQRGDTVDVSAFDELTLDNHHDTAVTFEYQISDIPILTQAQKVDVSNAVVVSEIQRPVSVVEIQRRVKTEIQNELLNVHVDNDTLNVMPSVTLYTYAAIGNGTFDLDGSKQTITGSAERKALFLQVPDENTEPVTVQDFIVVNPGGHLPLKTNQAVTVQGKDGEAVRVGEMH
ncbi:hypothetical protein F0237_21945 [Vibrio tubiashii]|uniref:Uncharacterized protein n=2 Tax=Vibrio tubiashii TaxID=29498 RepID=A0AAE5EWH0_9VIBR|nr:hypothetical protein [Vibrio tubiashii]